MSVERIRTGSLSLYVEGVKILNEMRGGFMDASTYTSVVDHTIIVCTDAVIVETQRKTFFLAKRAVRPMKGLWWIGGRRRKGEVPVEAMRRTFLRETNLDISSERFIFTAITEYLWRDREQEPCNRGSHNLCHQFVVELTQQERALAASNLDTHEYERDYGLKEFDRPSLVAHDVHPVILETYDELFPIQ